MSNFKAVVAVLIGTLLPAPSLAKKAPAVSDEELSRITLRGRLLYDYDQAAWHATDAVKAVHPEEEKVGRYIAQKTDHGWVVAFGHLNEARDAFLISYMALQGVKAQEFSVQHYEAPKADSSFYLSAAKALEVALADFQGDNRPYNAAVLPAGEGKLNVYLLPAQTVTGVFPLGGDERYLVSSDGSTLLDKHRMHRSVMDFDLRSPDAARMAAGYHIHILSGVPEDSDVFFVLTRRPSVPEFIGADKKMRFQIAPDGVISVNCKFPYYLKQWMDKNQFDPEHGKDLRAGNAPCTNLHWILCSAPGNLRNLDNPLSPYKRREFPISRHHAVVIR